MKSHRLNTLGFYLTFTLTYPVITAEVVPVKGKSTEAALALQRLGFQVLHVGESVTIGAEKDKFEEIFKIELMKTSKAVFPGLGADAEKTYHKPDGPVVLPGNLKTLVEAVYFQEPPDLFI
jgi:hypothetical protein